MEKSSLTIEIEMELKEKIQKIADQMGVSVGEWCAMAVAQQLFMQESMEDLMMQVGEIGIDLENMDLETITNQLFSSMVEIEDDDFIDIDVPQQFTPKIILPESTVRKIEEDK